MNPRTKLTALALAALGGLGLLALRQLPLTSGDASPAPASDQPPAPAAPTASPAATESSTNASATPAPAFPSLLAEARIGRPGPASRPIADRFAKAPTIWTTERVGGANNEFIQRIRLIQTEMKYPLVRLEEVLHRASTPDGPKEFLLQQLALVGDHLLLKPVPGIGPEQLASQISRIGGRIRTRLRASGTYLVEIPATTPESLPQHLSALRATGITATAEPDYVVHTCAIPNDPSFASLWGMHNTGGTTGTVDADIDAPEAWSIATGSRDVLVGIIDTGIDYTHPDLAANIWTNPGEIPGNGIDDENNGFIDDVHGWDFCNDDNDPIDNHFHGTHCAGTIGAVGNNGIGIAGVTWNVSLVPLRFLTMGGYGNSSDAVEAVAYANQIGVTLTSNSWSGGGFSQLLKDVIDAAGAQGRLFIAAAGNNGVNTDTWTDYPAGLSCAAIITVAATDRSDQLASLSNYGANSVDLAAPGVEILSTFPYSRYVPLSGTSMAAPHVSGAAALLKSAYPQLTGGDIKALLLSSVDPLPALVGKTLTGGRLNVAQALQATAHAIVAGEDMAATGQYGGPFTGSTTTYSLHNIGTGARAYTATTGNTWLSLSTPGGSVPAGGTATLSVSLSPSANTLPAGTYVGTILVTETDTGFETTRHARLEITPPSMHSFFLDSDPGWTRTGQWAFGTPHGKGGTQGNPDPAAAATGSNVFGINLAGDYASGSSGPDYLTTGPLVFTGYTNTHLRFRRWLNVESPYFAAATIDISTDGAVWTNLWTNNPAVTDSIWTTQVLDLSAYADNQAAVYLRWGHQSLGMAQAYSGWNLDDIEILGQAPRTVTFAALSPVNESAGTLATSLQLNPAPDMPTTITLACSLPDTLSLPTTLEAPAGATSIPLTLTILDDTLLNGTREVSLRAQANSYVGYVAKLLVNDNESASLGLTLPANGVEGGVGTSGTVTCTPAPAVDVTVELTATPRNQIGIPGTVILPAGIGSATFPIAFPDNQRLDRTTSVTVTAAVTNWTNGTGNIAVQDNESTALTVTLPPAVAEGDGTLAAAGTVRISGTLTTALTVSLTSSDTSELTVPAIVTIPAGATSATFDLGVIEDGTPDGSQTVTLSASTADFTTGQTTTAVADAAVHHFTFDLIPSPQYTGVAFPVRIVARDVNNDVAAGFRGITAMTADSSGSSIPVSPTATTGFTRGIWNGSVTLNTLGAILTLHGTGGGTTANSNPFQVRVPPVQVFAVASTDLAYSATTNRLYASTASGSLIPIDPDAATIGSPVEVAATSITQLAMSSDGTQLYTVHANRRLVTPVSTATLTPTASFAVGSGNDEYVQDLVVAPNRPGSLVVALNDNWSSSTGVAVFENGSRRPNMLPESYGITCLGAGALRGRIYGFNGTSSDHTLLRATVDDTGITAVLLPSTGLMGYGIISGGSIIMDSYSVIDGETGRRLASLPDGLSKETWCIDNSGRRIFTITRKGDGSNDYILRWYDTKTFEEVGRRVVPAVAGYPSHLLSWGERGLAFRTSSTIYVLTGDFVPNDSSADLDLRVTASPSPAIAGQPLTYTLLVTNLGGLAANNVVLTDLLPTGTTYGTAETSQGSITRNGSEVTVTLGSLAADATALVRIQVAPGSTGSVTNSATVLAATEDPTTLNNRAVTTTEVGPITALRLKHVAIDANALCTDGDKLFVTLSSASSFKANSVVTVDPRTLAVTRAVHVGNNPSVIALTDDGAHAQIGLRGSNAMIPINLATGTLGTQFSFEAETSGYLPYATDLVPLPASNSSVAVVSQFRNALTICDEGVPRQKTIRPTDYLRLGSINSSGSLTALEIADCTYLNSYAITALGPVLEWQTKVLPNSIYGTTVRIKSLGDLLLSSTGIVIDTNTRAAVTDLGYNGAIAVDPINHRVYFVTGSYPLQIIAFETDSWKIVASLNIENGYTTPVDMVRWGLHGLAFITETGDLYSIDSDALVPNPPLSVLAPDSLVEGAGLLTGAGRVELAYTATAPLTVQLTSSAPGIVSVPASVFIPQDAKSATFDLSVANNNYLNGTRSITIAPSAPGALTMRPATIAVNDDEIGTITLTMPTSATEGDGELIGKGVVSLSAAAGEPVTINLASNNTTELTIPRQVIIAAGQTSAEFAITVPDDDLLDGPQTATVTASVAGWTSAAADVAIDDNDPTVFTFTHSTSLTEGHSEWGYIHLSAKTLVPVSGTIQSSNPDALFVSGFQIFAGETGDSFHLYTPDNTAAAGSQFVTITASAPGFTSTTSQVKVIDDDPAAMEWKNISGPLTAGDQFGIEITMRTIEGELATGFWGAVPIQGYNENGAATVTANLATDGVAARSLMNCAVQTAGTVTRLVATLPSGISAESNAFAVTSAATTGFHWDPIASPQQSGITIPVTIRSADRFGNPTAGFTGTASLSAFQQTSDRLIGTGTFYGNSYPLGMYGIRTSRMTMLLTSTEIGHSGTLRSLALDVTDIPAYALTNFTIRLKHTSRTDYATNPLWESSGWTLVYQKTTTLAEAGLTPFEFTTPFAYDGTSNLLVDFSFNNASTGYSYPLARVNCSYCYPSRAIRYSTSDSSTDDPLGWDGAAPAPGPDSYQPNVVLKFGSSTTLTPLATTAFADGIWSGSVSVLATDPNVVLTASSGTMFGRSNAFAVAPAIGTPAIAREPTYTAGTSNTIDWSAVVGATGYQAQCATSAAFTDPTASSWLSPRTFSYSGLADATPYFYRVRASNTYAGEQVIGPWSPAVSSTQDATGPALTITSPRLATAAAYTLSGTAGDLSGVASLTVDGTAATTTDSYAHWSRAVTLQAGANTFTVSATDLATPGQTSSQVVTVSLQPLPDDSDGDGLPDYLEYALGLDPLVANATGVPTAALQVNPTDGLSYLTFTYRRRLVRDNLTYHVETTSDLKNWTEVPGAAEISAIADSNGLTETVTVRLQPAIDAATPRRFVRLKVTTP